MSPLRFQSVIKIHDGNPYIHISKTRATALKRGWRKPLPVLVRINGKPKAAWPINMMPMGDGRFYLYLHGHVRKASNTAVGDRVDVEVGFDDAYRGGPMHPMPAWFRTALHKNKKALAAWNALIPSRKKEILRYFSWLKSPEARLRNLEKALHVLSGKPGRFMARSWNE
ncbi:MAG: YdeI/OmpD-associated family protein [Nibricoccus sp.]